MPCAENDFRLIKCELVNLFVTVCLSRCSPSEFTSVFPHAVSLGLGPSSLLCSLEEGGGAVCRALALVPDCLELHFCSLSSQFWGNGGAAAAAVGKCCVC